jgi:hypothetical protein
MTEPLYGGRKWPLDCVPDWFEFQERYGGIAALRLYGASDQDGDGLRDGAGNGDLSSDRAGSRHHLGHAEGRAHECAGMLHKDK